MSDAQQTLDLFADAPSWVTDTAGAERPSIEERFWRFHVAHPEVYRELAELARQAVDAGRERIGIAMLFEVVRWSRTIADDGAEDFRLNNDYRAHYARLLMERELGCAGLFETRRLRAVS